MSRRNAPTDLGSVYLPTRTHAVKCPPPSCSKSRLFRKTRCSPGTSRENSSSHTQGQNMPATTVFPHWVGIIVIKKSPCPLCVCTTQRRLASLGQPPPLLSQWGCLCAPFNLERNPYLALGQSRHNVSIAYLYTTVGVHNRPYA